MGFRSDIPELLAVSDLFVLPSYSEGLPVSVLEAMAAGVPVIVTDVGGVREVAEDSANALIVPPASPSALTEKITFCMNNPAAMENIVGRARKDVVNAFDIKTMLASYRTLYSKLLEN
jgi:glycosyltransferase involved in cell wall biosynthesis